MVRPIIYLIIIDYDSLDYYPGTCPYLLEIIITFDR